MEAPRSFEQRKLDTLVKLTARHADVWVASASPSSKAHLVPLSLAWDGDHIILAAEADAVTTRNIVDTHHARLALGTSRDVVMIDVILATHISVAEAPPAIAERYAVQADWDPRAESGHFVYLLLRPERIQAWREANELAGRTLMREGEWLP
jgi:hypothetical protein